MMLVLCFHPGRAAVGCCLSLLLFKRGPTTPPIVRPQVTNARMGDIPRDRTRGGGGSRQTLRYSPARKTSGEEHRRRWTGKQGK